MNFSIRTTLAAFAISAAAVGSVSAEPFNQLAASAGLSQSEAAGLTNAQIAAHLFNRGEAIADRQTIPGMYDGTTSADAGMNMSGRNEQTLTPNERAAVMHNRGMSNADRIPVSRPVPGAGSDRMQLAASAGLGLDGAQGRTLNELATIHSNRGMSVADRYTVKE